MKKPSKAPRKGRARTPAPEDEPQGLGAAKLDLSVDLPSLGTFGQETPTVDPLMADGAPIDLDLPEGEMLEPEMGDDALLMPLDDGSLDVTFGGSNMPMLDDLPHDANLAEFLEPYELSAIANDLHEGIEADNESRSQWMADYVEGLKLLALKVKETPASDGGTMSTIRHPMVLEAVIRFQANARAELLPSSGPVKVKNDGKDTKLADQQADSLQELLNYYLTTGAPEYYPDTNRLLFKVGFSGMGFKKVYTCPIRRRPVSESVDPKDLIVHNEATDLDNAQRVTHRIDMKKSTMRRMQLMGIYRDVTLPDSASEPDPVKRAEAQIEGRAPQAQRPEDQAYELYECYCEIDLPQFPHKGADGQPSGLPLPYRITMEVHSKEILEIKRCWREGDPDQTKRLPFVDYRYIDGLGFYAIGLMHILGNTAAATTAGMRMLLDAGMFNNFPGGLRMKVGARQTDNNLRPKPGEFVEVDTGGIPIGNVFMQMPYNEPSPALMQLVQFIGQMGARLGNIGEMQVGEGKQNAPVGTTLALLDQETKVISGVHKNLHAAQAREFEKILDEIRAEPSVLWRRQKTAPEYFEVAEVTKALENIALIPVADPNVPSRMHRMAKAQALAQLVEKAPQLFNVYEVTRRVLEAMDIDDVDELFAPPQPPVQQPDPFVEIEKGKLEIKKGELQVKAVKTAADIRKQDAELSMAKDQQVFDLAEAMSGQNMIDLPVNKPSSVPPTGSKGLPKPRGTFGGI